MLHRIHTDNSPPPPTERQRELTTTTAKHPLPAPAHHTGTSPHASPPGRDETAPLPQAMSHPPDATRDHAQLRHLLAERVLTEQRDRHCIATDLHDHLAQLLVACKMKLALLRPALDTDRLGDDHHRDNPTVLLEQITGFLDESLCHTRRLVARLSPVLLFEQGLLPALHWLAERVMPQHGLAVTLHEQTDLSQDQLSEDACILLFDAVRELLFRLADPASDPPRHLELTVRQHAGGLEIIVHDDTANLTADPTPPQDHHTNPNASLFSIHERMALLGGHLDLAPQDATLWLPLAPAATEALALLDEPNPPDSHARRPSIDTDCDALRLLVVDDHAVVREGLVMMLSKEPNLVVVGEASNGRTALDLADQFHPDVVLMDVSMPEMDGIETTQRLTHAHPDIKVVGLSMHEDNAIATAMRTAGAAAFLCKGCSHEALTNAIHHAVSPTT